MGLRPFEPMRAMRDLDRKATELLTGVRQPHWVPVDAWREGEAYHLELDLPGVDPASIDVQVQPSVVTVTAHRGAAVEEGEGSERQALAGELPRGAFSRRFSLGEGLDLGAVEARYADGVLHLTIPLAAASRPRRVKVDTAGEPATSAQPGGGETHAGGPAPEPTGELGRVEGQTYDPSI